LNIKAIRYLTDRYKTNSRVVFCVFTNAFKADKLFDIITETNTYTTNIEQHKFSIQISYDGLPIQNLNRVSSTGSETGEVVRANILKAIDMNLPITIHPVITPDAFKLMYEAYLDFRDIVKYQKRKNSDRAIGYNPFPDYFNDLSKTWKPEYIDDLYNSLEKILKKEKVDGVSYFGWNTNKQRRALCSVGVDIIAMSIDGRFYKCHGAFFSDFENREKHYVTTVDEDHNTWVKTIKKVNLEHQKYHFVEPDKCKSCDADFCLRCQIAAHKFSDKEDYFDRFTDYNSNNFACKMFNLMTLFKQKINLDK